ncbi:penicillin-binding protein transpeptidase [Anaeromyxobacter dehalogenans 2CP-1]|uniref:Penicillin-binding protein transpeptidase n=1 Tax=Anaeromyxobacter dehalogenans (strain ATCC BAA-258 / DSM 21875 / 2CP-1) TaxID=455488 RepID=B8JAK4_ANAD2|nr:penicillin-binding transpeptidase domain-containing protein [Anaeromyxobacter dehalogenans]ACL67503.1 penicillin-binding protein transpeptidase [Anaeromyxobacter dehalogenans 2CP-1]
MKHSKLSVWLLPASALVLAGLAAPRPEPAHAAAPAASAAAGTPTSTSTPAAAERTAPLGEPRYDAALGRWVAPLGQGRAVLTIDPRLQARLERTLASNAVPWGVTVLIEPATGRVLAMAEHSEAEPARKGLARAALAPAASIFKIVTTAALLERGVRPDDEVCYHGGKRRLQPKLLADDPRRDSRCLSLTSALGHSANVVFAKLAGRDLGAAELRTAAGRFLFGEPIPFALPVEVSPAPIPEDPFELANTAAGFGPVRLSPLHAALLAATVANGGVFVPPSLVEEADGASPPVPPAPWRVIDEQVAGALAEAMRSTVTEGTARKVFRRGGPGSLRGVEVAGKTGSLTDPSPYRDYSWFVGYAPLDRPEVAVATLVVNGQKWRTRATAVARDALEAYFSNRVASAAAPGLRTAKAPAP